MEVYGRWGGRRGLAAVCMTLRKLKKRMLLFCCSFHVFLLFEQGAGVFVFLGGEVLLL